MTVQFIRVLFVLLSTVVGYQLGLIFNSFRPESAILGGLGGAFVACIIIFIEINLARVSLRGLSAAVFGLMLALIVSKFLTGAVDVLGLRPSDSAALKLVLILILSYLGMVLAMRGRDEFSIIIPYVKLQRQKQADDIILLDTSVIIDGRIADIVRTRFVQGHFVVPQFVLKELQTIADSSDSLRREKGRRGLDILNRMRSDPKMSLRIHEEDFPNTLGVDAKLVKLARLLDGRILTNDFNLNKVAELQDVTVLNVNELAGALRPVLLPGEKLEVHIVREGKERDQGLAYLPDGTMIVVEHGKKRIGETLDVLVTSALQTAAGRMIFARPENDIP